MVVALRTPGNARTRASTWLRNCVCAAAVLCWLEASDIGTFKTFSGSRPRSTCLQRDEAARQQPGAGQEHQRQRDLSDHERATQPAATIATARAFA